MSAKPDLRKPARPPAYRDRPARPEDRTAIDERGDKPVRGPENIDGGRGHDKHHPGKPPPEARAGHHSTFS